MDADIGFDLISRKKGVNTTSVTADLRGLMARAELSRDKEGVDWFKNLMNTTKTSGGTAGVPTESE